MDSGSNPLRPALFSYKQPIRFYGGTQGLIFGNTGGRLWLPVYLGSLVFIINGLRRLNGPSEFLKDNYMRVIKFRGKRIDNGEWVYGNLLEGVFKDTMIQSKDESGFLSTVVVDKESVGQFTGLKDKYEMDLYVGDVYSPEHRTSEYFQIMFISGAFVGGKDEQSCNPLAWDGDEVDCSSWMIKVGNIHDNPELLNPLADSPALNTMNTDPKLPAEEVKAPATETEQEQVPQGEAQEGAQEEE